MQVVFTCSCLCCVLLDNYTTYVQMKKYCNILYFTLFFFSTYCDACNALQKSSRSRVQLLSNGKNMDCNQGMTVGEYTDVVLSFCAPDLNDFLQSQNIARDAWDQVVGCHVIKRTFLFTRYAINYSICTVCFSGNYNFWNSLRFFGCAN